MTDTALRLSESALEKQRQLLLSPSQDDQHQRYYHSAIVSAASGDLQSARNAALQLHAVSRKNPNLSAENFVLCVNALSIVDCFQLVADMFKERYNFKGFLEFEFGSKDPGLGRQIWSIGVDGSVKFTFDESLFTPVDDFHGLLHFNWVAPLLFSYLNSELIETGAVRINQWDRGLSPGLCYCDSRPDYFLIPDYVFIPTKGYTFARQVYKSNGIRWSEKQAVAFWRGATTGLQKTPGDWQSLERVALCKLVENSPWSMNFDVGLSSIAQLSPEAEREVRSSGLLKGPVPWQKWDQYKLLIDIDGNSSAWSNLFQRLLTGGCVLKVESYRGLRQWYYDELRPWKNYVPVAPDVSDLVEKVNWLIKYDDQAQSIGEAGRQLALRLTYESEIQRSMPVISRSFVVSRNTNQI